MFALPHRLRPSPLAHLSLSFLSLNLNYTFTTTTPHNRITRMPTLFCRCSFEFSPSSASPPPSPFPFCPSYPLSMCRLSSILRLSLLRTSRAPSCSTTVSLSSLTLSPSFSLRRLSPFSSRRRRNVRALSVQRLYSLLFLQKLSSSLKLEPLASSITFFSVSLSPPPPLSPSLTSRLEFLPSSSYKYLPKLVSLPSLLFFLVPLRGGFPTHSIVDLAILLN